MSRRSRFILRDYVIGRRLRAARKRQRTRNPGVPWHHTLQGTGMYLHVGDREPRAVRLPRNIGQKGDGISWGERPLPSESRFAHTTLTAQAHRPFANGTVHQTLQLGGTAG